MPNKNNLKHLLHFFDRPTVPIFYPRGAQKNVYFKIPAEYFPEKFKHVIADFADDRKQAKIAKNIVKIKVPANAENFDLTIPKKLSVYENFSTIDKFHRKCAAILIDYLTRCDIKSLLSTAVKISLSDINPHLFLYALSVTILNRKETKFLILPSPITHSPEFFVPYDVIRDALHISTLIKDEKKRPYIDLKPTASFADDEHRVAYFREDIGVNIHHWRWHVAYPIHETGTKNIEVEKKDRRGELFYYMHQQIGARYNFERFCNLLPRTKPLNDLREAIPEGYFSKLGPLYSHKSWPSRQSFTTLKDVRRDSKVVTVAGVELYSNRIKDSIHYGYVHDGKNKILLEEKDGIDILGNIIEANPLLTVNGRFYGNLHNAGHILISYAHDPEKKHLEEAGVMSDEKTAMRDPLFYRWHAFIDDLFQEYKKTLPSYTKKQLTFPDVYVTGFKVVTLCNPKLGINEPLENEFITYKQQDTINMVYGLDVTNPGSVFLRFPHLQHQDFEYKISVKNAGKQKVAVVRIFLAPKNDETRTEFSEINPSSKLNDQKKFFIELDKFKYTLKGNSVNTITRSCYLSSVTITFKRMFTAIDEIIEHIDKNAKATSSVAFCGCGWPHHMLIPKGHSGGYPCQLFVMLSDYEKDKVTGSPLEEETKNSKKDCKCRNTTAALSFCGIKDKKYPDKRAMGYPFDRPANVKSIEDFLTPNMKLVDVKITHKNITLPGETLGATPDENPFEENPWDQDQMDGESVDQNHIEEEVADQNLLDEEQVGQNQMEMNSY